MNSYDACWVTDIVSNGDISMDCEGSGACQSASIILYKQETNTAFNCSGSKACAFLHLRTPSDVAFTCDGDHSCGDMEITSHASLTFDCMGAYACSASNLTGIGDLYLNCNGNDTTSMDACSDMYIVMNDSSTNDKVHQSKNTLLCGSSYACAGIDLYSFADIVTFECNHTACYHANVQLLNTKSHLSVNCSGYEACGLINIASNGHLESMICSGSESCRSANILMSDTNRLQSIYCNGDSACSNLKMLSPNADISLFCSGSSTCKSLYIQSLDVSMNCIGDETCAQSYITGNGNLWLDCSSDGTNTCSSMMITMRASLLSANTANNTLLCGNDGINSSYSCYETTLTSAVKDVYYKCGKNYGCYSNKITLTNALTTLNMSCLHDNACYGSNILTDGGINLDCRGSGSCEGMKINPMNYERHNIDKNKNVSIHCNYSKSCEALQVMTMNNVSLTCNSSKACDSTQIQPIAQSILSMECNANDSCSNVIVIVPDVFENGFFELSTQNVRDSSNGLTFHCSSINGPMTGGFVWNDNLQKYQCTFLECCPWNPLLPPFYFANNTILCNEDECNINASNVSLEPQNPFYPKYDASFVNIDALNADNLSIHCDDSYVCTSMNVQCPIPLFSNDSNVECMVNCSAPYACNEAKIENITSLYCADSGSCLDLEVIGATDSDIHCFGDHSNASVGSCDNMQIIAPNSNEIYVECKHDLGCHSMKIDGSNADFVHLSVSEANGMSNSLAHTFLDVMNAKKVQIECKGLCHDVEIEATFVNEMFILCDTQQFEAADAMYFGGCNSWNVNAQNAQNVDMKMYGKYAAPNGKINVQNAQNVNVEYLNNLSYDATNDQNYRSLINAPSTMNVSCVNYGCYFGNFLTKNGLTDLNVSFEGDCNCTSIDQCVDEWKLQCEDGSNEFNGKKCSDGSNVCCDDESVQDVDDAFDEYLDDAKCPSGGGGGSSSKNGLSGGAIAGIIIAVLAAIALIVGGALYWKRQKAMAQTESLANSGPLLVND